MKILMVLEYFWPQVGGVETLFLELAAGLVERGHQITVLTARLPGTPARGEHRGIQIWRVGPETGASRAGFSLAAAPLAARLARQADLIQTTTYTAALPAWLAGRLSRRPLVLTVHELIGAAWHALPDVPWGAAALYRLLERACIRLPFGRYVAVSRATRNALRQAGVPDGQLRTVYNGLSLPGWVADPAEVARLRAEQPPGSRLVTYYGRSGVTKGVEVLIGAVALLRRARPEVRLRLILGAHPEGRRARLEAHARGVLGEAVQVLSSVPRQALPNYLRASDCVAVPSLTEGFGFTAVETAQLGVPVVASDAGSLPEVLSGAHLLVPPGDPAALAAGLLRALDGLLESTPPRRFSAEQMVSGYEAVYRELLPGYAQHAPASPLLDGRT